MARIYLDARGAATPVCGVARYCQNLIPALAAQAPQHEFIVVQSHRIPPFTGPANVRNVAMRTIRGTLPLLASGRDLGRVFRQHGRADLYHSLFHVVPFGVRTSDMAPLHVVVTLHDLIWIDYPEYVTSNAVAALWRRRLALVAIPYALRTADHVICDSQFTSEGANRWIPPEHRSAIHLGVGAEFLASDGALANGASRIAGGPYIAAFGTPRAYKNITCLVRAFAKVTKARPDLRLVLIGGDGGASRDIVREGLTPVVNVVHGVSDVEMRAIIRGAQAFVVPSLVEGFGLPAIEAMALGTPVIVSDTPALSEVVGDAALRFDASSPSQLADVLIRLLGDPGLRSRLAADGKARAASFRWSRTSAETLAVYDRVLAMFGADVTSGVYGAATGRGVPRPSRRDTPPETPPTTSVHT